MPRPIPTRQYEVVLDVVARHPEGVGIEQIDASLHEVATKRTLQRWLNDLISQGYLRRERAGRATRYRLATLVTAAGSVKLEVRTTGRDGLRVPLTAEAESVQAHVLQPLSQRNPVGYNLAFLDGYRPNRTFYLPESIRAELKAQGSVIDAHEPAGTYARQIASRLLIDLSWNSSRLEGNTYSLLETEHLLSVGEAAEGKDALEAQMILNHKEAIEFLLAGAEDIQFNRYTIQNLHALLSENLLPDPGASGRLRTIAVGIGQTSFTPLDGPQRIAECFDRVLLTAAAIEDPFEQAFFAMVHLPYLQPFEDVNKRVSRLAANIPLIRQNLCPLSFVDVPQQVYISAMLAVYELNRVELLRDVFVWAYQRSCARYSAVRQSVGEPDPFRMRYRIQIGETVAQVVRMRMNKVQAVAFIRSRAEQLAEQDRSRFVEVVETQLMTLHLGSIARFRLRPSEFEKWAEVWQ
ncbi:Fic family protein [Cupriavidus cauae]|uniref:Fic family protein n=1 Tax=Cupriavidus cauae TaxID=2608999 RepID=UPI0022440268|nr:Fic family protein [Cupriavidus cauae]UZN52123.1 Fic family protein [Cupriavidus cauae]